MESKNELNYDYYKFLFGLLFSISIALFIGFMAIKNHLDNGDKLSWKLLSSVFGVCFCCAAIKMLDNKFQLEKKLSE